MTAKNTILRVLCGLIVSALLIEAVACSDTRDTQVNDTGAAYDTSSIDEPEGETERWQTKDNLPDDINYNDQEFGIMTTSPDTYAKYYQGLEEQTGDVVDDAIIKRNQLVEDRLHVKLRVDDYPHYLGDGAGSQFQKLIMAEDTTYSVMIGTQYGVTQVVANGNFMNGYDLENIDFAQPWWNNNYMDEVAVGNHTRYLLVGDYDIDVLHWARVFFFNKVLYGNYYGNPDDLYGEVLDGVWTIDYLADLSKGVYVDLNNNAKTDLSDQLGYATYLTYSSTDPFIYGSDVQFTQRDEEGYIELTMLSDRAVTLCEKVVNFFWQDGSSAKCNSDEELHNLFASGTVLFMGNGSFRHASNLRNMEYEIGYLPYPKLDEQQKEYRSLVHDTAMVMTIPIYVSDTEMVGTCLEALCAETYRYVIPAWYEVELKIKYTRDSMSAEMIDMINASMTTNFIYAYNYALNNIGLLYRDLVTGKQTDYASKVAKVEKGANRKLEKLMDTFAQANEK